MLCARACEGKKRDKKTYHDGDIGHEEKDGFIHRYCDSDEQAWCNKNELGWAITGLVLASAAQGEKSRTYCSSGYTVWVPVTVA